MEGSSVWKECRTQEKNLRGMMIDRRKRAEKKREQFAEKFGSPLQHIFIGAQPATLFASTPLHQLQNSEKSL